MSLEKSRSRYERWQFEKMYDDKQIKIGNERKCNNLSRRSCESAYKVNKAVTKKPPISPRNTVSNSNIVDVNTIPRKKSIPEIRDLCYFMFEDEVLLHDATFVINCSNKGLKVYMREIFFYK